MRWMLRFCVVAFCFAAASALSQTNETYRDDFSGKDPSFVKGADNVRAEEKAHDLSKDRSRSLPTSEHFRVSFQAGKNESNYAYYYYPTPVAPLTEDLTGELWVHSSKAGVQLLARVVFPKIRNPKQIDEPLTRLILLDTYKAPAGGWQKLLLKRPAELLQAQKTALRLEMKGDPDVTDAYIDRLVLNLYTGPGEIEVFVDNLEIGPVKPRTAPPGKSPKEVLPKEKAPPIVNRGVPVDYIRGNLTVGGEQIFPRFVRYTGTPMQVLKQAGFNAVSMPPDVPIEVLEEAINNYQFWIVPQVPPLSENPADSTVSPLAARDADALTAAIRKFQPGDSVLFWDLGSLRSEDYRRASRTVEAIRAADPKRPVGADVYDGFARFAVPLQLVGTHRDPLMSTLELDRYSQWLTQRRILASGSRFNWTWIQCHMPDWQLRLLYERPLAETSEPIGPQPEQIRLLTYIALASGCKGLGFWGDRYLADSHHGRDRLLQLALLNQEIEMLEPILLNLSGEVRWVTTSSPFVNVAILKTVDKGLLVLPIWTGAGAQYVPPQGSVAGLTFSIPIVPDGAEPWELSPVRVRSLQPQLRVTAEGTQVTLPEFDLTSAIVFTSDRGPDGILSAWQKHVRRIAPQAASWACDLAEEQYHKVLYVHRQMVDVAPKFVEADRLIKEAERRLLEAKRARNSNNDESAYFEAMAAMRPLRVLARTHWENANRILDYPAASPYAVSYYTLPRHWQLAELVRSAQIGENALPSGDFNGVRPTSAAGEPVTLLPGWTVQEVALDDVVMSARIVPGTEAAPDPPPAPPTIPQRYLPTDPSKRVLDPVGRHPETGNGVLRLSVGPRPVVVKKGDKPPPEPVALERVFVAVNSPPVRLTPGTWVRISGWIKLPADLRASADGAMMFDTATGEAYAVRVGSKTDWRQFHSYRKVPANGEIRVRLALTGFGTAYFDDIRVEPILNRDAKPVIGEVDVLPVKPQK